MLPEQAQLIGYECGRDHLADELRLLDTRISVLLRRRGQPLRFSAIAAADAEIDELMVRRPGPREHAAAEDCGDVLEAEMVRRARAAADKDIFLPLPELSARFGLARLDERLISVCLAPHVDGKYARLFSYLNDDVNCRHPTIGLALDLVCASIDEVQQVRLALARGAPLVQQGIIEIRDDHEPTIRRSIALDDRIVDYLLEMRRPDARLAPARRSDDLAVPPHIIAKMHAFFARHARPGRADSLNALFCLRGPPDSQARSLAEVICTELGISLLTVDCASLPDRRDLFESVVARLVRDATLADAAVCLENCDALVTSGGPLLQLLIDRTSTRLTFLTGQAPWCIPREMHGRMLAEIELPGPASSTREFAWRRGLATAAAVEIDGRRLAQRFQFSSGQIAQASAEAVSRAWWNSPDDGRVTLSSIQEVCRAHSTPNLGALAQRIRARRPWRDLVLPQDANRQLRELCDHARHRDVVFTEWGFEDRLRLGKGINALFCGTTGSGKTLAAEVIASELERDLYRVDLSQVVSKYIGETEKQLRHVFDEAQGSDSILFFDEADALFGKRSEVKDAHDRYANIEVGYLLQRMEEYDGIAILATNLRRSLDDAFTRRLRFVIEFPFPEEAERALIWRAHLTPQLPVEADLDLDFLAASFKLSGGSIRNIVLAAAFDAAADGRAVAMRHMVRAVRREYQKMGRICAASEFGQFGELLRENAA